MGYHQPSHLLPGFPHAEVNERVSASGAVLLTKLGIRPFEYKMEVPPCVGASTPHGSWCSEGLP